jgi:hypothetical protein
MMGRMVHLFNSTGGCTGRKMAQVRAQTARRHVLQVRFGRRIALASCRILSSSLTLSNNDKSTFKKADFVLAISRHHPCVATLYEHLSFAGRRLALSQMMDAFTKRLALFAGLEVKPMGGDAKEAVTQLLIWFSAGLTRQTYL